MCFLLLASSHTASLVFLAPALPSLYDVLILCLATMALHEFLSFINFVSIYSLFWSILICPACLFFIFSHKFPNRWLVSTLKHFFPSGFILDCLLFACMPFTCNCLHFGKSECFKMCFFIYNIFSCYFFAFYPFLQSFIFLCSQTLFALRSFSSVLC